MAIVRLLTPDESIALDKYTIEKMDFSGRLLMGYAASSVFTKYRDLFSTSKNYILCGSGNNGGDGLAIAYLLEQDGIRTNVYYKNGKHSDEYNFYLGQLKKTNANISDISQFQMDISKDTSENRLIVDCLLGTGFRGELNPSIKEIVQKINLLKSKKVEILSIDTLSGFHLQKDSVYVKADILAEIGSPKYINSFVKDSLVQYSFHPIGFPIRDFIKTDVLSKYLEFQPIHKNKILDNIQRSPKSHKYSNGAVAFIGGSDGMSGAILLSQSSFQRMGGGISKIFSPSQRTIEIALKKDESVMTGNLDDHIVLDNFYTKTDTVVIGPGLKPNDFSFSVQNFIKEDKFYIIDAGALELFAHHKFSSQVLLTPHSGEFQRIIGQKNDSIQSTINLIQEYCTINNVYMLYKSHFNLLGTPQSEIYIWNYPNPILANMGTGDILTGLLALFLSRGMDVVNSVLFSLSTLDLSRQIQLIYPSAKQIIEGIANILWDTTQEHQTNFKNIYKV